MSNHPNPKNFHGLILASSSPYRRQLLARLGLNFECIKPDVDERPQAGEATRDLALRLAREKARAIAASRPHHLVIGSDQVAELEGKPLGKPGSHARARAQLQAMSGRKIHFHTALAAICHTSGFEQADVVGTQVHFRTLTAAEIERYLLAEKPYDCAGSAKSEGLGISLMQSICSQDPTALIGLPLIRTAAMLRAAGLSLP